MKKTYLLIIILIVFSLNNNIFAQYENIRIDIDASNPEEPTICINPKNTQQLVAGSNLDYYYYSNNGGYSWDEGILTSIYDVSGDPCIICDTAGSFYFFHLSNPSSGSWLDRIVCQKTANMANTWTDGNYMGLNGTKDQDKEWATVDRANNNIYVSWTQFDAYGSSNSNDSSLILFSRSTNSGLTWSSPIRLSQTAGDCIDDDNTVEGAVPAVGTNGEIYVAWAGKKTNGEIAIMFDKSYDNGETWLDNDILVTDFPEGWAYDIPGISRCNGLPVTVCDTSNSPNRGTIYINWSDQQNGTDDTDIWLIKSTDEGDTWSDPIRVNDDAPGSQQFFTWLTIDQVTGYLYCVFYDRRNYTNNQTDVYMAKSIDGGETFENIKISESPFTPNASVFFGDYTNITAHNGIIRPIWTRLDNHDLSLWTAIINEEEPNFINANYSNSFMVEQNYPNPFAEETFIAYKLYKPAIISLKIFNMYGTEVYTLINHKYHKAGKYVESFDNDRQQLLPGIYYISLISGQKRIVKKMIIRN